MAKIIKEGTCCSCCASMIANNDESGCRDFYGHTHPSPYDQDHGGYLVITSSEDEVIVGPCSLCGQGESGYMEGHTYAVLADDHAMESKILNYHGITETLGSCGCTDYHMADCPTRTGSYERDPMDDYDPYDY